MTEDPPSVTGPSLCIKSLMPEGLFEEARFKKQTSRRPTGQKTDRNTVAATRRSPQPPGAPSPKGKTLASYGRPTLAGPTALASYG